MHRALPLHDAHRDGEYNESAVSLDLLHCSSEDEEFPAFNLQVNGASMAHVVAGGWQSEKFCEYPQELIFSVNHGMPTRVERLQVLSHHCKIASKIELFASVAKKADWRRATFHRLGFLTLGSNEKNNFSARELKSIQFPTSERVTLVRLLLHPCHTNKLNLFNQVGIVSLVLTEQRGLASSVSWPSGMTISSPAREDSEDRSNHMFATTLSPLKSKYKGANTLGSPYKSAPALVVNNTTSLGSHTLGDSIYDVWIPERMEYMSPDQIFAHVQIQKERAELTGDVDQAKLWGFHAGECRRLHQRLTHLQRIRDNEYESLKLQNRVALNKEIQEVLGDMGAIERRITQREKLHRHLMPRESNNPGRSPGRDSMQPRERRKQIDSDRWQDREEYVWSVIKQIKDDTENEPAMNDALDLVKETLRDPQPQVFTALCSLLTVLLTEMPRFHVGTEWKQDVVALLDLLVSRLDDQHSSIRNNAAFCILKIADLTRARGSLIMHHLLKKSEQGDIRTSDQVLYSILKIFAALLMAFHCCATIDIAPKRVMTWMLRHDAHMHSNPHVRDAAKQLTLIMCVEVGAEVLSPHLAKLPAELQDMYLQQFALLGERKPKRDQAPS
ncbi:TPA: hypothetical protein N0F65_006927 [Lagenidium giganteum]|uniref:TOG domain-containing protein n=1 Tax=Lagenidium giganteum TaxID=4803 RepID=A0AAV2ZPX1_9STRA|nr:TPA: hypothetical protein N0F65_006927 [Lagenidium giganteum]